MIIVTLKTGKEIRSEDATAVEEKEGWVHVMKGKETLKLIPIENVEQVDLLKKE